MVFSSLLFLFLFLPLLLIFHFSVPKSWRNAVLLIASILFYWWGAPEFIITLLIFTGIDFFVVKEMSGQNDERKRRILLVFSICINMGLLFYFKYSNFFIENLSGLLRVWGGTNISWIKVALPIGISFFTFETLTYSIDIYRRQFKPLNILSDYYLYIFFFPKLIAGPIIRYHDIEGQLHQRTISLDLFVSGIRRFIIGLTKKVLIANTVAAAADKIFKAGDHAGTFSAWIGIICYTLQIYFDFSGYSDMAIGLARMFGFRFLENFNFPYIAASVQEFWRRWHISLSNWFRDYLYIPLGGNRESRRRTYFNLVLVFFICGLWHGANWTFVVWGLMHGFFLVLERGKFGEWQKRWPDFLRHFYLLLIVMFGWVFFRCETIEAAVNYFALLFNGHSCSQINVLPELLLNKELVLTIIAGIIFSTPVVSFLNQRISLIRMNNNTFASMELTAFVFLFIFCAASLASGTYNPFIYFRF